MLPELARPSGRTSCVLGAAAGQRQRRTLAPRRRPRRPAAPRRHPTAGDGTAEPPREQGPSGRGRCGRAGGPAPGCRLPPTGPCNPATEPPSPGCRRRGLGLGHAQGCGPSCSHTLTQKLTHVLTHSHSHSEILMCSHTHAQIHTCPRSHMHTHHSYTCPRSHMLTHTYTHTQ